MHRISGLDLKFTGRNTWTAGVYRSSNLICEVPVAWADQLIFDRQHKRPKEFLVWFTRVEKAAEFVRKEYAIIAVAKAIDTSEMPRRFKEFTRLFKVHPRKIGTDARSVIADFVDIVTSETIDR